MGTVLGAYISKAGRQIDLITRNISHVEAMKKGGAHITGSVDFTVPVSALTPGEMAGLYDVIFLMTKQRENRAICEFLSDFLAENGAIVTLQNGIPEPGIASVVGSSRTLGCAVSWGATFRGEGCAELTSSPEKLTFSLGSYEGSCPRTEAVKELLECMGEVTVENNFMGARWSKLSINSAFSSLSAISGLTFGEVACGKLSRRKALGLLNEAFAVAEACGIVPEKIQGHDIVKVYKCRGGIKEFVALRLLPLAMKHHKNLVSGMYFDLKEGKKCDIDSINGIIVHAARNFGVETPMNLNVLSVVRRIEKGELSVSPQNLELI